VKLAEIERLKKLLALTQSENDHEALAAMRRANAILAKHNIDWNSLFAALQRPAPATIPMGATWYGAGTSVVFTVSV
jgi:hypothetical protein